MFFIYSELDDIILNNLVKSRNEVGKTEWRCNLCGKKGLHKTTMMRHIETHLEQAQLNCPHCDKVSRTREALRVHIRDYHKQKGEVYYAQ